MRTGDAVTGGVAVFRDQTELSQARALLVEQAEQLRDLSLRDELTGHYNRRGFLELAEHELKLAARANRPCAVFFADLNGLKRINDELGHDVGDEAIQAGGSLLAQVFRSSDVISRLGGDEFAIFASECDQAGAEKAKDRLQRALAERVGSPLYRLSISMGAAIYDPADPKTLTELMQTADAIMYDIKRSSGLQRV
jgi:diguanylate cyclase (GGDEF)-like protein